MGVPGTPAGAIGPRWRLTAAGVSLAVAGLDAAGGS
jgi:hypothetical protein